MLVAILHSYQWSSDIVCMFCFLCWEFLGQNVVFLYHISNISELPFSGFTLSVCMFDIFVENPLVRMLHPSTTSQFHIGQFVLRLNLSLFSFLKITGKKCSVAVSDFYNYPSCNFTLLLVCWEPLADNVAFHYQSFAVTTLVDFYTECIVVVSLKGPRISREVPCSVPRSLRPGTSVCFWQPLHHQRRMEAARNDESDQMAGYVRDGEINNRGLSVVIASARLENKYRCYLKSNTEETNVSIFCRTFLNPQSCSACVKCQYF